MNRYKKARIALIFWCLFIGVGAVFGSLNMLIDPTGSSLHMNKLLSYFEVLPFSDVLFQNYTFPGIALLIVNGLTNLTAAFFLIRKKQIGNVLGMIFGITLMLWITIQFIIFPTNPLSISYFIFGFIQFITGYMCIVFYKQEYFIVEENSYKDINTNKKEIVVYFSRMGYTKKIALEEANKTGAIFLEIKTPEKTDNTSGFWWCGRYGMHRWPMRIEQSNIDFSSYDKVTICSPIWVFNISSPIRQFCIEQSGKIKNVKYIFVHHMRANFIGVADELDKILNIKRIELITICCQKGIIKSRRVIK